MPGTESLMTASDLPPLSKEELAAEAGSALPDKEVVSILDLNADLDLAIDAAAPIDLGVAANANVAAPIDAAVGANVLSVGSTAQALSDQGALINQGRLGRRHRQRRPGQHLEQGASPTRPPTRLPGQRRRGADGRHRAPTAGDHRRPGHRPWAPPPSGDLLNVERQPRRRTPTSRRRSTGRWRRTPTWPPRSTPPCRRERRLGRQRRGRGRRSRRDHQPEHRRLGARPRPTRPRTSPVASREP